MPKSQPSRMYMRKKSNTSSGKKAGVLALVVVILAALGGAYLLLRSTKPATLSTSANQGQPVPSGDTQVLLVVDGWSYKIMDGATFTYQAVGHNLTVDKDVPPSAITFKPATSAQLNQIAHTVPTLVRNLFARLATTNPSLRCTETDCTVAGKNLPLSDLLNPSQIPTFGSEYAGYGINHGVYIGSALVPKTSLGLAISAPGWNTLQLSSNEGLIAPPGSGDSPPQPSALNGYLKNLYPLATGFGQIFPLSPTWVGASPISEAAEIPSDAPVGNLTPAQNAANAKLFADGLSTKVSAANTLDPTQLTYMTSPTTGCGPGVACTPMAAHDRVVVAPNQTLTLCYNSVPIPNTVILSDSTWYLSFAVPTSQYGAWNGKNPAGFASSSSTASPGLYTGAPTLAKGTVKLRESVVLVYTQPVTQLTAVFGTTEQYGYSSPSSLTQPFNQSSMSNFGQWTSCKSSSFTRTQN